MAIDARIALGARVAPQVNVADIFNRVKQQQQGLEIGKQNIAMNEQAITQQAGANQDATNNRVLKSVNDFAINNQSIINEAVNTNNPAILQEALVKRRAELVQQGLPTETTDDGIAMLSQGNIKGVVNALGDSVKLFNQQQGGQQQRVVSSKVLADGTTVQSLSTGGTNVISQDGETLTGNARSIALNNALAVDVLQKGAGAQAVSNVKVDEIKRIEGETSGGILETEAKRLNIDETKIINEQKRTEAINSKNSRREESDAAVLQISSLLAGDRFASAFGKLVTNTPDIAKSQKSIDALSDINQIKGLLMLESRQKLAGQGSISEGESNTLADAATVLNNPLISDDRARRELRKVRNVFEASSDRNQLKKETKERPTIIKFDAQGNQI
jgi:hypothetical protein